MDLKAMAELFNNSSPVIAGAIIFALLILNAKSIVLAIKETIAEFNRGQKQEAEARAEIQSESIRAGQEAVKTAIEIVTRMADASARRMEEMEREIREMRVVDAKKDARLAEQDAEIAALKVKVAEQAAEIEALKAKGVKDEKQKRASARRSAGRAAAADK